jgi:hypothetical protein
MGAHTVWVKLFEKAYASLFTGESYANLGDIAGREHGRGGDVFHAILGTKADSFGCNQNDPWFMKLMGLTSNVKGANNIKQVKDNVFKGDEVLVKAWMAWFTPDKAKAWVLTQGHGTVVSRWEDFEKFLAGAGSDMPENIREYIVGWISEEGILPGRRGTGLYSAHQKDIFTKIQNALAAKKPVTVGANPSVAKASKVIEQGQSGEGKAKSGLVGQHAYSILDAKPIDGLLMVQLHNPWNDWGVKYEKGIHTDGRKKGLAYMRPVVDRSAGTFWLELCDLTKHFKSVYVGDTAVG